MLMYLRRSAISLSFSLWKIKIKDHLFNGFPFLSNQWILRGFYKYFVKTVMFSAHLFDIPSPYEERKEFLHVEPIACYCVLDQGWKIVFFPYGSWPSIFVLRVLVRLSIQNIKVVRIYRAELWVDPSCRPIKDVIFFRD